MAGGPDIGGGGLKFDTVSVLYANLLFIVLSLLPFHFRERSWYRRILFWYYAVINSLLIVAVNLADCVYFRYTQKRFTSDEIFFTDNSNSAQLVLKFAAENWYLLLVGAVLIWLFVWGYGRKITPRSPLREGWVYYSVNTGLLVIAILLGIAGMRGGVTRMTRPITLSNATLYASTSEKANLIPKSAATIRPTPCQPTVTTTVRHGAWPGRRITRCWATFWANCASCSPRSTSTWAATRST